MQQMSTMIKLNVESGLVRGLSRIGRARDTGETTARLAGAGVFPALPFKDTAKSHNGGIWISTHGSQCTKNSINVKC